MASTLEDLLRSVAGDGAYGQIEAARLRQAEIARAEIDLVHAALSTEPGQKLMEWLILRTLLRPPGDAERAATTLEAYALAKARREGEASVIYMLLAALQRARGDKVTQGGTPHD